MVNPEHLGTARALKPIHERPVFGRSVLLFDHVDRNQLAALGEVRRPSIADLFVAIMSNNTAKPPPLPHETTVKQSDQVGVTR
jgi:ABC-2 type transport system ATP-binding protein